MGRKRRILRGRPKGEKTYPTTIRLNEARIVRLNEIAQHVNDKRSARGIFKGITFTEQISKAVDMYIKSYEGRL